MMYTEKVSKLFFYPKHVGVLDENQELTAHCSIVQEKQNTVINLFWQCTEQGIIQRACFKAVGSPYIIAGMEWLCAEVEGKKLDDLPSIDYQVLIKQFEIPKLHYPAAVQIEALYKAMKVSVNNKLKR